MGEDLAERVQKAPPGHGVGWTLGVPRLNAGKTGFL